MSNHLTLIAKTQSLIAEVDVADERASAAAFDVDLGDFAR